MSKSLMIQGTSSHVGKSVLVTALCRIFHRQGLRTAPFKAQNMALNAYVCADGREMARAQATQAEAAGILPSVEMNPVLLKATSHTSAQVILMGKVVGNMGVLEYRSFKPRAWELICEAYRSLSEKYDLILIEGAGSPAEINLMAHDIVNMRVAEMANAPVLLAGDIDRGGIFAAFVGTLELLPPEEQKRVAGFIINKFRGDASLLEGGLDFLSRRLGRKVFGVVPYLEDIDLPEEDGVALEERAGGPRETMRDGASRGIRISVVRLPHISNFTDFDPLRSEGDVHLSYLDRPSELAGDVDLLILPGTKQTLSDLSYLRETGWEVAIKGHLRQGGRIAGICGGYQLLGERVADPEGVEGRCGSAPGLGLLPVETVLHSEKRLVQVQAKTGGPAAALFGIPAGTVVRGYEIHVGVTRALDARPPLFHVLHGVPSGGIPDGCVDGPQSVWGTYLHGLFENDGLRRGLLGRLRERYPAAEPLSNLPSPPYSSFKQRAFDRLADAVERALDLKAIHDLL